METTQGDTVKKDKGEHIRGKDLKITEKDVLKSMPFFMRMKAWLFGGAYGMRDPSSKMPKILVVFLPSAPMRFYYKHFYKHQVAKGETNGEQN